MRPPTKRHHVLFALFLVGSFLAQTWPVYAWAGTRIEPRVLGLPFSFAWVIGWVGATFVALALYHRASERERGR